MKRREFLKYGAASAATLGLTQTIAQSADLPEIEWDMATSWPTSLDTIFGGAQVLAERVAAITAGKFKMNPRAAGEVAPGTEVLNVVEQGAVPCGHTASYYYVGRSPVMAFGTSLPFGLNAQQQNAWLYDGGGLAALQEYYANNFGVIQFPAGNTGVQMGGWFRKEINTVADLVMSKLGVTVQVLPGGEIFQALQTGAIDAAEWVGPYDDEKLGLNKAAEFYYYPGWWEPGPTLELQVNLAEWEGLPVEYQEAVRAASYEANMTMLARYDSRNNEALGRLQEAGVQLRAYSDEILAAAEEAANALYEEYKAADADFATIFEQWDAFRGRIRAWHNINEGGFSRYTSPKE
jgi:TRAP-type mannitol/chloroaromatic compound transport system substrate-binding protein